MRRGRCVWHLYFSGSWAPWEVGPWGTGVSPWVPLRRTEGHCYLGDSWEGTEKVAGRERRGGRGPQV